MPRGGSCNHRNCYDDECKMLTDEELTPSSADLEEGKKLVAEGWFQTSRKFRHIARVKPEFQSLRTLLLPEYRDTELAKLLEEKWQRERRFLVNSGGYPPAHAEHRELSVKLFAAFRKAGGGCW